MFSKQNIVLAMLLAAFSLMACDNSSAQTLYGSAGSLLPRENAANVDWAYNWGIEPNNNPFDVNDANYEFVPMIWSANPTGVVGQINRIFSLEDNFGVHVDYVLGFNEPELPTQANMSVPQALDTWDVMTDAFANTDIKLVSPAVSGNGGIQNWLVPFMEGVEQRNNDSDPENDLQVDVIAYHFYTVAFNPQAEAQRLIDQIDDLWATYQRPIWITEFAGTSFSLDNPVHSIEERTTFNRAFLQALIPAFDQRDYVERVSWWQFGALGRPYSALSTLSGGVYTPTIVGEVYFRTILESGQSYDFAAGETPPNYVHYLKGGTLTNTGVELGAALRAVDNLSGIGVITGNSDFEFEDADDAFIRVRAGTTFRKQGTNEVTLSDSPFFNDGSSLVSGGTLRLADGARLSGVGIIRTSDNGTLATSGGVSGGNVYLDSRIIISNTGVLHVEDSRAEMTEELRIWNPGIVRTDGDLLVSGITAGAGRILSTGEGTLFLSGEGQHASGATVSEGSLIVANADASATGAGSVLVEGTGLLGGFGLVDGNVLANSGVVSPGVSQGSSGLTTLPVAEGVLVDALDFDFMGVQDDAPLEQTSVLSGGLELVSGLDFGSGVRPRGAVNDGNEFNVAGFPTNGNYDAAVNNGDYLTFTIAPIDGLAMVIENVTFELRRNGSAAAEEYVIGSSLDGFAFAERWGLLELASGDTSTHIFTASNPGDEAVADEVEIRIVGLEAGNDGGNTHFYSASVDASFATDPNSVAFDPTGILELGGDYTQLAASTLQIELGGTSNSDPMDAEFDQLLVAGDVQLDGTLEVSFVDGFEPNVGDTFDIIVGSSVSGSFDTVNVPGDVNLTVNYLGSIVRIEVLESSTMAVPDGLAVFRGILVGGGLEDVVESDNSRLVLHPGFTINSSEAPVWLILDGQLVADSPLELAISVESRAGTPGLTCTVEAWDWTQSQYDVIGDFGESFNIDSIETMSLGSSSANYAEDGTGSVRSRVGWRKTGFTINFPWQVSLDHVVWTAE